MNRLGYGMAAVTWFFALLELAHVVRFGECSELMLQIQQHGSVGQVAALCWLTLILICFYTQE